MALLKLRSAVSGEILLSIKVDNSHNVIDIKDFLIKNYLIEDVFYSASLHLVYNGIFLDSNKTIEDYNIESGSDIDVIKTNNLECSEGPERTKYIVIDFYNTKNVCVTGGRYQHMYNISILQFKTIITDGRRYKNMTFRFISRNNTDIPVNDNDILGSVCEDLERVRIEVGDEERLEKNDIIISIV